MMKGGSLLFVTMLYRGAYTFLVVTSIPTTTMVPTKLSLPVQNTTECHDTLPTCGHYGHNMCTEDVYRAWAMAHCPRYCGLCTPTVISSNECTDNVPNCDEYDSGDLCTNSAFTSWTYDNCRGYCKLGICSGLNCQDIDNDCHLLNNSIGICSKVDQARNVCQKYCGLCDIKDGQWSDWTTWGSCDVTCGSGTQVRRRTCTNPSPSQYGLDCTGSNINTKSCGDRCPVDGGWSNWDSWYACSVTCGVGLQHRVRSCNNPVPEINGRDCQGENTGYKICFQRACSDGGWSHWAFWSNCSVECGGGVRSRERSCTSPAPSRFGLQCQGNSKDTDPCNTHSCQGVQQNNALQALKTYANANVAFTAKNLYYGTSTSDITFLTVLYNLGNGFSSATGKFTAPLPGVYQFTVSLTKKRTDADQMYCYLQLNGINKVYIHVDPHDDDNSDYGSYSATSSAVFHLNKTDYVNLNGCTSYSIFESNACTFTGILVRPDLQI